MDPSVLFQPLRAGQMAFEKAQASDAYAVWWEQAVIDPQPGWRCDSVRVLS